LRASDTVFGCRRDLTSGLNATSAVVSMNPASRANNALAPSGGDGELLVLLV